MRAAARWRRRAGFVCAGAAVLLTSASGAALAATHPAPTGHPAPTAHPAPAAARARAAGAGSSSSTPPTTAPGPVPPTFAGDVQSFAVRIEADEPLPVGPGDIPSLTGQVNAQEDYSTATSSVDLLGAVVGPKVVDPFGEGHAYDELPQATCLYPSPPNTDAQSYPTDGADQQTAQSEVTCSDGPSATGLAYSAQLGGNAGVTNPGVMQKLSQSSFPLGIEGVAEGHEDLGPDPALGAVKVSTDAEVSDFSIPGVLHVAGIEATGWTAASGRPGGAATQAQVTVSGLTIGDDTISLDRDGVTLGTGPPVPLSGASGVINEFNQAVAANGCNLTLLSNPATYPQGPLFSRPPLPDRVNPAGTDAGSTAGGFVVRCVVPQQYNPTNFNPLILQIVLGFVGTEADASTQAVTLGIPGAPAPAPSAPVPTANTGSTSATVNRTVIPATGSVATGGTAATPAPSASSQTVAPQVVAAAPATTQETAAPPGPLVSLRSGLEVGGLGLAALLALLGLILVSPWRVSLAPVDHPEV